MNNKLDKRPPMSLRLSDALLTLQRLEQYHQYLARALDFGQDPGSIKTDIELEQEYQLLRKELLEVVISASKLTASCQNLGKVLRARENVLAQARDL
jgi:hypothetical protein